MRDLWLWWKDRTSQIKAVLALGLVFLWMSLNLWQTQRNCELVIRAREQSMRTLEAARKFQLERVIETLEVHEARQDLDRSALRDELCELRLMIGQLIAQAGKQTVR